MSIRCPQCSKKYDVAEFENGRSVRCRCGTTLDLSLLETVDDFVRFFESEEERKKAKQIQKDSDSICRMILDESCSDVDIEIAKKKLEEKVSQIFPDKMETYRMIYEARFNRLWEQFRSSDQEPHG